MRQEYKVLQGIRQCRQVCKPRGSGYHSGRFFMVLDLLGQNLVEMRRGAYGGRMDLSTAKVRGRRGPAGPSGRWGEACAWGASRGCRCSH